MERKQYIQDIDGARLYRTSTGYLLELKNKTVKGSSIDDIKEQLNTGIEDKPAKSRKSTTKTKAESLTEDKNQ